MRPARWARAAQSLTCNGSGAGEAVRAYTGALKQRALRRHSASRLYSRPALEAGGSPLAAPPTRCKFRPVRGLPRCCGDESVLCSPPGCVTRHADTGFWSCDITLVPGTAAVVIAPVRCAPQVLRLRREYSRAAGGPGCAPCQLAGGQDLNAARRQKVINPAPCLPEDVFARHDPALTGRGEKSTGVFSMRRRGGGTGRAVAARVTRRPGDGAPARYEVHQGSRTSAGSWLKVRRSASATRRGWNVALGLPPTPASSSASAAPACRQSAVEDL